MSVLYNNSGFVRDSPPIARGVAAHPLLFVLTPSPLFVLFHERYPICIDVAVELDVAYNCYYFPDIQSRDILLLIGRKTFQPLTVHLFI